jgi:hypothetical protein
MLTSSFCAALTQTRKNFGLGGYRFLRPFFTQFFTQAHPRLTASRRGLARPLRPERTRIRTPLNLTNPTSAA